MFLTGARWKFVKFPSKKQKNLLDTGLRRYDESKENWFQLPFLGLRIVAPAEAGVQFLKLLFNNHFKFLDSGLRRNDE